MTQAIANARLVLPAECGHTPVLGCLEFGPAITAIIPGGACPPGALDAQGDFLIPGAVDLHTDNLERQVQPRNKTRWPSRSALLMHDAHCAAAGVTTVFDSLCVGDLGFDEDRHRTYAEGAADLAAMAGWLKVQHFLHLRCELPATDMLQKLELAEHHKLLRMISLMDHTPGFGQYSDLARYRVMRLHDGEAPGVTERRISELAAQRTRMRAANRQALLQRLAGRAIALASHDDRTVDEVAENHALGITMAEFPVTQQAAQAARDLGQHIIAGAPNVVRGGSHTGNVAVRDLARAGLLDALASDYVPAAMIEAAFLLASFGEMSLPQAIATISAAPAAMVGLHDRGALRPGLRADLVLVRLHDGLPQLRAVWCGGQRVA